MSDAILIIGESGTGKSTAIKTLPPEKTVILNCLGKPLPFKGWKGMYKEMKDGQGNYFASDNPAVIIQTLQFISENRKDIEYIVIDDYIYTMVNEYMRRAEEKSYEKFTEIGKKAWQLAEVAKSLRDDISVAILTHSEEVTDASGVRKTKVKTVGKLVDNVVNLEGMFTVVLYTDVKKTSEGMEYGFLTKNSGTNTGKSPDGMFEEDKIPNDLKFVFEQMDKYNFG